MTEPEEWARFVRCAGEMLETAEHRWTIAHVGNVICMVMMWATWKLTDASAALAFGMLYLGATSLPVVLARALQRATRAWRDRRGIDVRKTFEEKLREAEKR